MVRSRCSLAKVFSLVSKFVTREHEKALDEIGFGSVLKMKWVKLHHCLCSWLLDRVNVKECTLQIGEELIKIDKEYAVEILGLPAEGVEVKRSDIDMKKVCDKYGIPSEEHKLHVLEKQLVKVSPGSKSFKAKFILWIVGCLLFPRTHLVVHKLHFGYLNDDVFEGRANWTRYVHKELMDGVRQYQMAKDRAYVSGCILVLQVMYLDVISGNNYSQHGHRLSNPLLEKWGEHEINATLKGIEDFGKVKMIESSFDEDNERNASSMVCNKDETNLDAVSTELPFIDCGMLNSKEVKGVAVGLKDNVDPESMSVFMEKFDQIENFVPS